jgi:MOSC domain-containing protein YiiM
MADHRAFTTSGLGPSGHPRPAAGRVAVAAVNLGRPRPLSLGGQSIQTAIFKQPVAGPVDVGPGGLAGDTVADAARHGGPDQAVYLFSREDAQWWSSQLQRDIPPGYFGENLTLDRWWPEVRVGDRLRFGKLELEVSFPRIPCATLAAWVGRPTFLKDFAAARRPGVYARVIRPGRVAAGDAGEVLRAAPSLPLADALFELWHSSPRDPALLRAGLAAPIAERARRAFAKWLEPTDGPGPTPK